MTGGCSNGSREARYGSTAASPGHWMRVSPHSRRGATQCWSRKPASSTSWAAKSRWKRTGCATVSPPGARATSGGWPSCTRSAAGTRSTAPRPERPSSMQHRLICRVGSSRRRRPSPRLTAIKPSWGIFPRGYCGATNDLDLETLDLLQERLAEYPGTALLVSHDRDFLDRVVTSVIASEGNGRWIEYAGGYTDMLAQRGAASRGSPPAKARGVNKGPLATRSSSPSPGALRMNFNDRRA